MDYIEAAKSRYVNYLKKIRDKPNTRESKKENINASRRMTRANMLSTLRNINEALSPTTPVSMISEAKHHISSPKKMDRITRMKIWKAEKDKKKEESKANKKPLFKNAVRSNVGFPTIVETKQTIKKSFAPKNHVFKPPKCVKPVESNLENFTTNTFKRVTRSQKAVTSPLVSLPVRSRRKEQKENNLNEIKQKNRKLLRRQNAFEETILNETNIQTNEINKKTALNHYEIIENDQKKGKVLSKLNDNKIKEAKKPINKKKSLRLNVNSEAKQLEATIESKSPDIFPLNENITEISNKRKSSKRKSAKKIPSITSQSEPSPPKSNKKLFRRKSLRKSTSHSDKENDLNSTFEVIDLDLKITPIKDVLCPPVAYISPFVTTSRGKGSIKKENKERSVRGLPSFSKYDTPDKEANTSFQITGASYFQSALNNEISRLNLLCENWTTYKESCVKLSEDSKDLIDVAVGQANLLMNKKFQQFRKLIISCENGYGEEKPVTCEDLQGFWDMIYIQVDNLSKRFQRLTDLKDQNWKEVDPVVQKKVIKKEVNKKRIKSAATSSVRAAIEAARKKAKSVSSVEDIVFDAGFFLVKSPKKKPLSQTPNHRSLLKSVLSAETRKSTRKTIGSPGVTMMKASQTAKSVEKIDFTNLTPTKSILKKKSLRQTIESTAKAVLFKDYDSN